MASLYSSNELRKVLTRTQFQTTRRKVTEVPFKNQYWDCFKPGIYKCVVCKTPLFSSEHKYEDGFGWPAFYDQLPQTRIQKSENYELDYIRTQASCARCKSHLGYIFNEGCRTRTGKRYCINSNSLQFSQQNPEKR